jgi:hypothetical protein
MLPARRNEPSPRTTGALRAAPAGRWRARVQRVPEQAPPEPQAPRPPPIRLRFVLLFALLGLAVYLVAPRALANWRLHGAASEFANYALCMVGPTGPSLLRDQPGEFWRRVRRRIVAAEPAVRPFALCSKTLADVEQDPARRAAHAARADEFVEHTRYEAAERPRFSLAELRVTTEPLERLLRQARPFAPRDYTDLVRPTFGAVAAAHPADLPVPGRGRGLPEAEVRYGSVVHTEAGYLLVQGRDVNIEAVQTADNGKTWSRLDSELPAVRALGGTCTAGQGTAAFRLRADSTTLRLEHWGDGAAQASAVIGDADATLVAFSCDEDAALLVLQDERHARPQLKLCPSARPCKVLKRPSALSLPAGPGAALSAVRVRGAIVLALSREGVVRVTSSRDDGESWTPLVVAYDRAEQPAARAKENVPERLLALGGRVLLYGAPSAVADYPLLASDDFGASWHAP